MSDGPVLLTALIGSLAGAAIGSFIGAALIRLPTGRTVFAGRSACDSCAVPIALRDLVPLVSWIALRGRCRRCGAAIGMWQPSAEIGGAVIGGAAALLAPPVLAIPAMLLGWQLLLLALVDARHLWLPKPLTALLAASGAVFALWRGWEAASLAPPITSAAGGAIGYVMLWSVARGYRLLRGREGMGGGDPPLLGAIGLWVGPMGAIGTVIGASMIGLAAALVMLLFRKPVAGDTALPLGTLMAPAGWTIFLVGGWG